MQKFKLAYFGSPDFSAAFLQNIILDKTLPVEVILVVTQPDKPVGRNQILTPSPVKLVAKKYNITVYETGGIRGRNPDSTERSEHWREGNEWQNLLSKSSLALVYAYGKIIPKELLSIPPLGFWNIHPSLLPLYRGASPIAYPLVLGDTETGVSLIKMNEKMDEGPIIAQEKIQIDPENTRTNLENKLTDLAFKMFKELLAKNTNFLPNHLRSMTRAMPPNSLALAKNKKYAFKLTAQNNTQATYTFRLQKSDGFIPFETLKKMLKNEKIDIKKLPLFLQKYLAKYSNYQFSIINQYSNTNSQSKIENWVLNIDHSSKLLFNLFRGLTPWPGLWTLLCPNSSGTSEGQALLTRETRLKITEMKIVNNQPVITKVQLEGKKPVDILTFSKAYPFIFPAYSTT